MYHGGHLTEGTTSTAAGIAANKTAHRLQRRDVVDTEEPLLRGHPAPSGWVNKGLSVQRSVTKVVPVTALRHDKVNTAFS